MRYRLRTLLIALALGPMVLAGAWWAGRSTYSRDTPDALSPMTALNGLKIQIRATIDTAPMFRLTIRDVLWLMLVVGMGGGWWMDHRSTADTELRLATALQSEAKLSQELAKATKEKDENYEIWMATMEALRKADLPQNHWEAI
jgi:hypothetical protein